MFIVQKPFTDYKQVIALFYLYFCSNGLHNIEQITQSIQNLFNLNLNENDIKNAIENFFYIHQIDQNEIFQLISNLKKEIKQFKNILSVPFKTCLKCNKELAYFKSYSATIYYVKGPKLSLIKLAKCNDCNVHYDIDKFTDINLKKKFFYSKAINSDYIMTSNETGFSKTVFNQCNEYLVRNGFSFTAFSDSYNHLFSKIALRPLQRQRLVECWFQAKILDIEKQMYSDHIPFFNSKESEVIISKSLESYKTFMIKKWTNQHINTCRNDVCSQISKAFSFYFFFNLYYKLFCSSCMRWQ